MEIHYLLDASKNRDTKIITRFLKQKWWNIEEMEVLLKILFMRYLLNQYLRGDFTSKVNFWCVNN